jgi:hypothetical protein
MHEKRFFTKNNLKHEIFIFWYYTREITQKVERASLSLFLRTWSNSSLYGFICKRFFRTRRTVADGICKLFIGSANGLVEKACPTRSTFASLLRGRPGPPFLQRLPSSVSFWYHSVIKFVEGASFPNLDRYFLCTIVTVFIAWYQKQHSTIFFLRVAILFNSDAAPFWGGKWNHCFPGNLKLLKTWHFIFLQHLKWR